ncbi:MAG: 2-methylcitrate synthase/citrate synthase II [Haloquadratum walsbyi J07HQW1]|jgi:citrate synthase|uniref:Citrate synthase n=1 Tax=Haloquadratum walsbyi J07HQW1 TaxID=1238424 RepID=U1N2H5_9EURY|nr:MAG: 2-methylcitrate synthase/citrate synthase II [Haloquadratum walsbyi J07HQW1]
MSDEVKRGLEDVLVAESKLSRIDGDAGELVYRGYSIEDLAQKASYEEVVYLLWHGRLPTADELHSFTDAMIKERAIDTGVYEQIERLAAADETPMAALRTIVSTLSAYDPDADADVTDHEANARKARRIAAKLPTALAALQRCREGDDPITPRSDLDHAANFLYMLNGSEPDPVLAETFDMALVLHADHGLNASTFSAKVTASTLSDLHCAITTAVGTLSGSLHGGANANVMRMLKEVHASDADAVTWIEDALASGRRVPGFGHRVYNVKDPRARILGERSKKLAEAAGEMCWYNYSVTIEDYVSEHKGLAPNVDFYSASTYYQMGIPIDIYTPIFAMARTAGWIAHTFEQYDENRLIRPRARYSGVENATFEPLEER